MKTTLLLDFDRTLFNTNKFYEAVWRVLAARYGVDPDVEITRAQDFYTYVDDFHDYDFFAHIDALRIGSKAEVSTVLKAELMGIDFLYPDAQDALRLKHRYELSILTFGNEPYQRFKLGFCPELQDVPTRITLMRKGDYIRGHNAGQEVTIVDDKQLVGTLPEHVRFIHLDRQQFEPVLHHDTHTSISSLSYLEDAL